MIAKQIVFTAPNCAELLDSEVAPPAAGQVTVRMKYTAVSPGTERANITGHVNVHAGKLYDKADFPRTNGYSGVGSITAVGEGVTDVAVGDRVAVHWGKHKSFQTLKVGQVHKVPADISDQDAAIAFIATFPAAALRKMHASFGESVLVMGLGLLGQLAVRLSRAAGLAPIIAADPDPARRQAALDGGADAALDPYDPDFADKVKSFTNGGAHMAVEVTGVGQALNQALDCMRRFGRVALLGCTRDSDFTVDFYNKVHAPGVTLIGAHTAARPKSESNGDVWTYEDDFDAIFKLLSGGRLRFDGIISQLYDPKNAQAVYDRLIENKDFPIGVLFDWEVL